MRDTEGATFVRAIADPFVALPVWQGGYMPCDIRSVDEAGCLLEWRRKADTSETRMAKVGRPYLLFDLNDKNIPSNARLVSMGPDGRYAGVNASNVCAPPETPAGALEQVDDLVLCLFR